MFSKTAVLTRLTAFSAIIIISACTSPGSDLHCSSRAVQELVIQIATDSIGKSVFTSFLANKGGSITPLYQVKNKSYKEMIDFSRSSTEPLFKEAQEFTLRVISKLHLEKIRLVKRDESVGRINCAASLVADGGADITYSAQQTEAGELYVEVYGLDD